MSDLLINMLTGGDRVPVSPITPEDIASAEDIVDTLIKLDKGDEEVIENMRDAGVLMYAINGGGRRGLIDLLDAAIWVAICYGRRTAK